MTVFNLGSINIDLFYTVPHFPAPGETLASLDHRRALGGKGANQSIALARASAPVVHIGATSPEDGWIRAEMRQAGVDTADIQDSTDATGHAVVTVSVGGENQILLCPSANATIDMGRAVAVLNAAQPGDWALLQNETNGAESFVEAARARGLKLAYSAAPFDASVTAGLLPHTDLLIVNEGEAAALGEMLGRPPEESGVPHLVITRGGEGADYYGEAGHIHQPAFAVTPVDTTGAGDCFFGYFLAGMARGDAMDHTLRLAAAAAALQVTQPGAAAAIPPRDAVDAFLAAQS
ncbi:MAG: ribokinase [Pseudomonadota bacterium]|nr:ribokinase [Pseudomonadota bacterium]